jgi:uncharacterized protein YkwD
MKNLLFIIFFLSLIFERCSPSASLKSSPIPQTTEETEIIETQETATPIPILDGYIEITEEEIIEENNDNINASKKEIECFNIINNCRKENGLEELVWDDKLYEYAKVRAKEASIKWSHTRPDGTSWKTMNPKVFQGENLAKGYDSAQDAVNAWMGSQGHKENILRNFTRTAVAFYEADNGWFWCQAFGY